MDSLKEQPNIDSFQIRIEELKRLLSPEVMSHLFKEFGQTFDKSRHFEIVMQIIVVDLLVERRGKIDINGVQLPMSTYMVAMAIILIHIIDDIFDNFDVFKKVAAVAYLYFRTFSNNNFGRLSRVVIDKMFQILKRIIDDLYFGNELTQLDNTTYYSVHKEIIFAKLAEIEDFLRVQPDDRIVIFKSGVINVFLAGLIQNITRYGENDKRPEQELEKLQKGLDSVYRELPMFFLSSESKMRKWYSNLPLPNLLANASGVLEMFGVLGKPFAIDMELYQALNSLLGPCVYLINYDNDPEKSGITFFQDNLSPEKKGEVFVEQLRYSWKVIVVAIEKKYGSRKKYIEDEDIKEEYNWKNIPESSLEYRALLAICLVYLFLLRDIGNQKVSFRTMPANIRESFLQEFYTMYNIIRHSVSHSLDSYLVNLVDLLKDFDFNPSES